MKTERILLGVSAELREVLDAARGTVPRGSFVEAILWRSVAIKREAARRGVKDPKREADRRGRHKRPTD